MLRPSISPESPFRQSEASTAPDPIQAPPPGADNGRVNPMDEPPAPVRVVEVTAERDVAGPPEIPWHIAPEPGRVAMQLRSTVRRVMIGAGLARRQELVDAVTNAPGVPAVMASPAGGTFVVGGPGWLGLCAIGTLPDRRHPPLDWMMEALRSWFAAAMQPLGVQVHTGRVEGAWCPGFSDVAVGTRKLAGLGFRVTRGMVVMRGVMPVAPVSAEDLAVLRTVHALIDLRIDEHTLTSLAEATGDPTWTVERAIAHLQAVAT